jgi:RHS repeat-associated protein
LVGDPIDVVTGANTDQMVDFRLPGSASFEWWRYYDSRRCAEDRGLGRGFTHELDQQLALDLDGLSYMDARGSSVHFPYLERDGESVARSGRVLGRVSATRYWLRSRGEPTLEFQFDGTDASARLTGLVKGDSRIQVQHEGRRPRPVRVSLDAGRVLFLEYEGEYLARVVLGQAFEVRRVVLMQYRYDSQGRLLEAEDAYHHKLRYSYNSAHRVVRKTDRRGYSFLFSYDSQGRCVRSRGEDGVQEVRIEYRPAERLTSVTRADGGVWQYFYDAQGTVTRIIDPYGGVECFELDEQGRVAKEVDPLGNVSHVVYDETGAPVERVDPLGYTTPLPEDLTAPDLRSHWVGQCALEWEYGELVPLPTASSAQEQQQPNLWGTQLLAPAAEPVVVRDLQGLRLREERAEGKPRRWAFDPNGNLRWYTDFDGYSTRYEYFSWNHLLREQNALGHVVSYAYTPTEKLTTVTDAGGTRSEYRYDLKDRLVEVHRHGRVRERYAYDLAGNLIEKRDGTGNLLLKFTIGPGNLKSTRTLASGDEHRFEYDDRGRVLVAEGQAGRCTFSYNKWGHRIEDRRDGLGSQHWYKGGSLAKTTVLGRYTTQYKRVDATTIQVTDPAGKTHLIQALGKGLVQRSLSSGAWELAQYDSRGRCLAKQAFFNHDSSPIWTRRYHFSAEGDLLCVEDNERGAMACAYDAAHRLARIILPTGEVQRFEYDAADNLLRQPGLEATVSSGNRLSTANGDTLHYDGRDAIHARDGASGTTRYLHDSRDQLIQITAHGLHWTAEYDPLGRRTRKRVNDTLWTYYWDTDRLAAEISPEGRLRIFVYAEGRSLVPLLFLDYDSIEAPPESGRHYFVFCDWRGAPQRIVDEGGQVAWQAQIDAYGSACVERAVEDFHQPLRFPGHYFDRETGLHYNRFRYYSPELGRYMESDPSGVEGGLNLYAYTSNPLIRVDVRGLKENCPPGEPSTESSKKDDEDGTSSESSTSTGKRKTKPKPTKETVLGKNEAFLSDDTPMPEGTRRIEYGNGEAVYYIDPKGRIIRAEGVLNPPETYDKQGVSSSIKPEDFISGVDHRGHLIPERGVENASYVNVKENVIAEHGTKSNLSVKKKWENRAIDHALENSDSKFKSIHEPKYNGDEMRPHEVVHDLLDANGNPVPEFREPIPNPSE